MADPYPGEEAQLDKHNLKRPLLVAESVKIEYDTPTGKFTAIQDVSFAVSKGEFISIVGPSGCGKTSLLNAMAGLGAVSTGALKLNGHVVSGPGPGCAVVFQSPCLLPWRTISRNIAFGIEGRGIRKEDIDERVQRAAQLVGLTDFLQAHPYQLSGGMQQRVNLARALVTEPEMLLLDEPFASVDAQTRERLQFELERICLETGITAVFVTHDVFEAVSLSNRVIVLSRSPATISGMIEISIPRPRLGGTQDLEDLIPFVSNVREVISRFS